MKAIKFLQFIPTILILIGISLWSKTLIFDTPINTSEQRLYEFWEESQMVSNPILQTLNDSIRASIAQGIVHRPDDIPMLQAIDTILFYQTHTLNTLHNEKANHAQVYQIYILHLEKLCQNFLEKNLPYITEERIEDLFREISSMTAFDDTIDNYNAQTFFTNRIILATYNIIVFYMANMGRISFCNDRFMPNLLLKPTLKKGIASKGSIFLGYHGNCEMSKNGYPKAFRINGKTYSEEDGVLRYTTVFKDTLPKKIIVERDLLYRSVLNNRIIESTKTVSQEFIIHPFKE